MSYDQGMVDSITGLHNSLREEQSVADKRFNMLYKML